MADLPGDTPNPLLPPSWHALGQAVGLSAQHFVNYNALDPSGLKMGAASTTTSSIYDAASDHGNDLDHLWVCLDAGIQLLKAEWGLPASFLFVFDETWRAVDMQRLAFGRADSPHLDSSALRPGVHVTIHGLLGAAQHNGKAARVVEFLEVRGRWGVVLLEDPTCTIALKPVNLQPVDERSEGQQEAKPAGTSKLLVCWAATKMSHTPVLRWPFASPPLETRLAFVALWLLIGHGSGGTDPATNRDGRPPPTAARLLPEHLRLSLGLLQGNNEHLCDETLGWAAASSDTSLSATETTAGTEGCMGGGAGIGSALQQALLSCLRDDGVRLRCVAANKALVASIADSIMRQRRLPLHPRLAQLAQDCIEAARGSTHQPRPVEEAVLSDVGLANALGSNEPAVLRGGWDETRAAAFRLHFEEHVKGESLEWETMGAGKQTLHTVWTTPYVRARLESRLLRAAHKAYTCCPLLTVSSLVGPCIGDYGWSTGWIASRTAPSAPIRSTRVYVKLLRVPLRMMRHAAVP